MVSPLYCNTWYTFCNEIHDKHAERVVIKRRLSAWVLFFLS